MFSGFVLSFLVGWFIGALANWAAEVLPYWHDDTVKRRFPHLFHDASLWWYVFQRGYCPHCGERRGFRAPLLEFSMIVVFVLIWQLFDASPMALSIAWTYAAFLLSVLVIDLEHRRVLNIMLAPAAIVAVLISLLPIGPDVNQSLLGGIVGFGLFLFLAGIGRGALGAGDVKLAGTIGLMTGYPGVLSALIIGMILGGVAAVILLARRYWRGCGDRYMAYAPYLSVGTLLIILQALTTR